ncbi:MAG: N-acetylglucosamine-6-phosphate deacetylase [Clostridia bacterium]|nr:N-acetylglucosamine-6-phosphate deacetylase [Clostridia bacterium]
MIIKNANVFMDNNSFKLNDIKFENTISDIGQLDEEGLDAKRSYLVPGFIDIHTHGAMGSDVCDGTTEALSVISNYYAMHGVTSFLATTMTYDEETLRKVMNSVKAFQNLKGARCIGVNMEGPFINPEKKGAQSAKNIIRPDIDMFKRLYEASGESIRIVDIAPEYDADYRFTKEVSRICKVAFGHTNADYDTAIKGFEAGASHVSHLFNMSSPFHHHYPGVTGAASDMNASVEIICDGVHIHPSVIRMVFKMFNKDKICLISDSMRSTGMPDGTYDLGGQQVFVKNKVARISNGLLAGSAINLNDAIKNVVSFGVKLEDAIAAATINPARFLNMDNEIGSIQVGKRADFLLLNENYDVTDVYIGGIRYS